MLRLMFTAARAVACLFLLLAIAGPAAAAVDLARIFPATTKGFVATPDMTRLEAAWNQSRLGQLFDDPAMQPFVEDMRRQLRERITPGGRGLGFGWEDLQAAASGAAAVGLVQPAPNQAATVAAADITGRLPQAEALLAKVAQNLAQRQARRTQQQIGGARVTIFDVPAAQGVPAERVVIALTNDLLVAGDNLQVVQAVLARAATVGIENSLASVPEFQQVMQRAAAEAGNLVPNVSWFVEPFGFAEVRRIMNPPEEPRERDWLEILRNQGFTAIQGVGGFVNFDVGQYEVLYRTAIYAPPVPGADQTYKYKLAARMLQFPNGGPLLAHPWVPADIGTYAVFNWDMRDAFEFAETLVDEIAEAEGVFEDALEGIRTDPYGPQVDIRRDLIGNIGNQASMIADTKLPLDAESERVCYCFEATDPAKVAETLRRQFQGDPRATAIKIGNFTAWDVKAEEPPPPQPPPGRKGLPRFQQNRPAPQGNGKVLPRSVITVAYDHVLVATHRDFLERILLGVPGPGKSLLQAPDYQRVVQELNQLGAADELSFRIFSRTRQAYRLTYELIRQNRLAEAETLLGQTLNALLSPQGEPRQREFDGSKLPEFAVVAPYLGPAGAYVETLDSGWMLTGFMLEDQRPVAAGRSAPIPR